MGLRRLCAKDDSLNLKVRLSDGRERKSRCARRRVDLLKAEAAEVERRCVRTSQVNGGQSSFYAGAAKRVLHCSWVWMFWHLDLCIENFENDLSGCVSRGSFVDWFSHLWKLMAR